MQPRNFTHKHTEASTTTTTTLGDPNTGSEIKSRPFQCDTKISSPSLQVYNQQFMTNNIQFVVTQQEVRGHCVGRQSVEREMQIN